MRRPNGGFPAVLSLIQRHMLRQLVVWAGTVVLVCALVALLATSGDLFSLLTRGILPVRSFVLALATLLPTMFSHTTPVSVTLGIGFMYYLWHRDQEIVVLRMAGLSNSALALPGIAAALVAALFTASMSLYLQPVAFRVFEDIRYQARLNITVGALDEGYPQQVAPDLSLSFRKRVNPNVIEGVSVLDRRKNAPFTYIFAERGRFAPGPRARAEEPEQVLILEKGSYLRRGGRDETVEPVVFEEFVVPLPRVGDAPRIRQWRGHYEEPIGRLIDPPADVRAVPEIYADWVAEGHYRLLCPVLCVSCTLFALGVLLRSGSHRLSRDILRGIAIAAFVLAWNYLMGAGHAMVVRLPGAVLAYDLMALVPGAIGIALLASSRHGWRVAARRIARRWPAAAKIEAGRSA